jgi:ATP-dependent DNA ligase
LPLVDGVSGILFSEALAAEKACEPGLEGIVSKSEGGFYRSRRSGSSRNWLKTINPDFVRA